jgi:peptide/nickel transport system ATP-binding protein
MTEPVLAIRGLGVTLHRDGAANRVLDGVSFDLEAGRITAIVGESGSGKSTIGLAAQGLLPTEARPLVTGSVRLAGTEVVGAPEAVLRGLRARVVRSVPQDPLAALNPVMRVGPQLREGAAPGERPEDWLPRVGLTDPARVMAAWPHQLSGGQRQRVLIAMAMLSGAPLLVADEPTTALDVTVQAQILRLLRQLAGEQGKAVLFVTHDLGVASEIADRILVLYGGRVAEHGPAGALLRGPRHPYSRALLQARFDLEADRDRPLPVLGGDPPGPAAERPGCAFAPRCPWAIDLCRTDVPPLLPLPDGPRDVACHRADEIATVAAAPPAPWPAHAPGARPALRLEGVSLSFGALSVLRGLDLTVQEGESVALVGVSGSGKSTILRLAAGLLRPDRGRVAVAGGQPQMVFQDAMSSLTPWLSVGEQLRERLRPLRLPAAEARARVEAALALVGLPPAAARALPRELSGGQAQRVAVARAVVLPPEVLLCDEPISAMDVSLAAQTLNLLGDIRRRLGMAMVFVTHDLAAARLVADRIVVLEEGRIVEDGPAEEVTARPRSAHARELIAATPRAPERMAS